MDLEAALAWYLANDLDNVRDSVSHPLGGMGRICEGALDERKAVTRLLEQRHGAVAVLSSGRADLAPGHRCSPSRGVCGP